MAYILHLVQIISSLTLVVLILLQRTQGDLGGGSSGDSLSFLQTRRGAERFIFILTIVVAVIFAGSSLGIIIVGY